MTIECTVSFEINENAIPAILNIMEYGATTQNKNKAEIERMLGLFMLESFGNMHSLIKKVLSVEIKNSCQKAITEFV